VPVKTADQIQEEVIRKAGKGAARASYFFQSRLKEVLSVPAPRRVVKAGGTYNVTFTTAARTAADGSVKAGRAVSFSATAAVKTYVATTPATKGAPPRKLSGRLRASIDVELRTHSDTEEVYAIGTNVVYARRHEFGAHPFMIPTLDAQAANIATIIGGGS